MSAERILVLGIGNTLMGDDGVGVAVLTALAEKYRFPESVRLLEGATAGLSLLPEVLDSDKVLVLDAFETGAPPGTVTVVSGESLLSGGARAISPHELGVADIVSAARLHGGPEEVVLLGVEPESVTVRVGLSDTVAASIPTAIGAAVEQLGRWGAKEAVKHPRSLTMETLLPQ